MEDNTDLSFKIGGRSINTDITDDFKALSDGTIISQQSSKYRHPKGDTPVRSRVSNKEKDEGGSPNSRTTTDDTKEGGESGSHSNSLTGTTGTGSGNERKRKGREMPNLKALINFLDDEEDEEDEDQTGEVAAPGNRTGEEETRELEDQSERPPSTTPRQSYPNPTNFSRQRALPSVSTASIIDSPSTNRPSHSRTNSGASAAASSGFGLSASHLNNRNNRQTLSSLSSPSPKSSKLVSSPPPPSSHSAPPTMQFDGDSMISGSGGGGVGVLGRSTTNAGIRVGLATFRTSTPAGLHSLQDLPPPAPEPTLSQTHNLIQDVNGSLTAMTGGVGGRPGPLDYFSAEPEGGRMGMRSSYQYSYQSQSQGRPSMSQLPSRTGAMAPTPGRGLVYGLNGAAGGAVGGSLASESGYLSRSVSKSESKGSLASRSSKGSQRSHHKSLDKTRVTETISVGSSSALEGISSMAEKSTMSRSKPKGRVPDSPSPQPGAMERMRNSFHKSNNSNSGGSGSRRGSGGDRNNNNNNNNSPSGSYSGLVAVNGAGSGKTPKKRANAGNGERAEIMDLNGDRSGKGKGKEKAYPTTTRDPVYERDTSSKFVPDSPDSIARLAEAVQTEFEDIVLRGREHEVDPERFTPEIQRIHAKRASEEYVKRTGQRRRAQEEEEVDETVEEFHGSRTPRAGGQRRASEEYIRMLKARERLAAATSAKLQEKVKEHTRNNARFSASAVERKKRKSPAPHQAAFIPQEEPEEEEESQERERGEEYEEEEEGQELAEDDEVDEEETRRWREEVARQSARKRRRPIPPPMEAQSQSVPDGGDEDESEDTRLAIGNDLVGARDQVAKLSSEVQELKTMLRKVTEGKRVAKHKSSPPKANSFRSSPQPQVNSALRPKHLGVNIEPRKSSLPSYRETQLPPTPPPDEPNEPSTDPAPQPIETPEEQSIPQSHSTFQSQSTFPQENTNGMSEHPSGHTGHDPPFEFDTNGADAFVDIVQHIFTTLQRSSSQSSSDPTFSHDLATFYLALQFVRAVDGLVWKGNSPPRDRTSPSRSRTDHHTNNANKGDDARIFARDNLSRVLGRVKVWERMVREGCLGANGEETFTSGG